MGYLKKKTFQNISQPQLYHVSVYAEIKVYGRRHELSKRSLSKDILSM